MFAVGGLLIFLAIHEKYEPLLLVPIRIGAILADLPHAMLRASSEQLTGSRAHTLPMLMQTIHDRRIHTEFLPPLIFLGGPGVDGLSSAACPTGHVSAGRGGPIGHLRGGARRVLPIQLQHAGGGLDQNHRRCRWVDLHLTDGDSRSASARGSCRCSLQLYVARALHSAADHPDC